MIKKDDGPQESPNVEQYRWPRASRIFKCELTGAMERMSIGGTASVYAIVGCTADHYHPENFVEPCLSCDLWKTFRDVRPGELPPQDYIEYCEDPKIMRR